MLDFVPPPRPNHP